MKRDFLTLADFTSDELHEMLQLAAQLKSELKSGKRSAPLAGKTLAMIFEKPSLRTRVTFEVGMSQLGGSSVYLTPNDIRLGEREPVGDIARNLDRWVDLIMARTFAHQTLVDLARHASVPVINGLSDLYHPCQVLTDCLTLREHFGRVEGLRIAFLGDGNNMVNSWINGARRFGFEFVVACPEGYEPDAETLKRAAQDGASVAVVRDPAEAARGADVLYTDVWTSMGQEAESDRRRKHFQGYQIDSSLVTLAKPGAVVMHCLPAHRGEEITAEVMESPRSIVFDQAENRLHGQKGILLWLASQA